jgi:hypothetical protein
VEETYSPGISNLIKIRMNDQNVKNKNESGKPDGNLPILEK